MVKTRDPERCVVGDQVLSLGGKDIDGGSRPTVASDEGAGSKLVVSDRGTPKPASLKPRRYPLSTGLL